MSTVLYIFASLGFSFFAIRQVIKWILLWQENDYQLSDVLHAIIRFYFEDSLQLLFTALFLLCLTLYGISIFYDGMIGFYEVIITCTFFFFGFRAIREIKKLYRKLQFTPLSLVVIFLTLFTLSLLYMLPLLDSFMWLFCLTFFTPFFITVFVGISSFPREVYSDAIMQRVRKLLFPDIPIILFVGDNESISMRHYLLQFFSLDKHFLITSPSIESPLSIAKKVIRKFSPQTKLIVFHTNITSKMSSKKLLDLLVPHVVILSGIPKSFQSNSKKKKFFILQKHFLESLPHKSIVLINGENDDLLTLCQTIEKPIFIYGQSTNIHAKQFSLTSKLIKWRKDTILFEIKLGRKKIRYKTHLHVKQMLLLLIPIIFVAHIWGMKEEEITKRIYSLGK